MDKSQRLPWVLLRIEKELKMKSSTHFFSRKTSADWGKLVKDPFDRIKSIWPIKAHEERKQKQQPQTMHEEERNQNQRKEKSNKAGE